MSPSLSDGSPRHFTLAGHRVYNTTPSDLSGILELMERVAIFGDVGGHADELRAGLTSLGVDADRTILPDGLSIVQVGDLIHRGPASGQVLDMVARFIRKYPSRWTQLAGNHEALYLTGAPRFDWPEVLPDLAVHLLNKWWRQDAMRVAAAVSTPAGDLLVTHAGLTVGLWDRLDQPASALETAVLLNDLKDTHPAWLWETGLMLGTHNPNVNAGPLWAEAAREVYGPWLWHHRQGGTVPFGLVHGHSQAYAWGRGWRGAPFLRTVFTASYATRHVSGLIGGHRFTGVDPGFGRNAGMGWQPLVLNGARLLQPRPVLAAGA